MELPTDGKQAAVAFEEAMQKKLDWLVKDLESQISEIRAKQLLCREISASLSNLRQQAEQGYL